MSAARAQKCNQRLARWRCPAAAESLDQGAKIIIVPEEGGEPGEYSRPRGVHVNVQEREMEYFVEPEEACTREEAE
jgi:hypothetical protein